MFRLLLFVKALASLTPCSLPQLVKFLKEKRKTQKHSVSALDWVGYNSYDNQGELMTEKEWDENVRKA